MDSFSGTRLASKPPVLYLPVSMSAAGVLQSISCTAA